MVLKILSANSTSPEDASLCAFCLRAKMPLIVQSASKQMRYVEKDPPGVKPPGKVEQIDKITMPGFIHPEKNNEEGYFTQQAKHQLEELKKKLEKPKVDNTEKRE